MDLYKKLGLPNKCSLSKVKEAYRKFARQYHPDYGCSGEHFKQMAPHWEILRDPNTKSKYDLSHSSEVTIEDKIKSDRQRKDDARDQLNFYKCRKPLASRVKEFYDLIQDKELKSKYRLMFIDIIQGN